MHWKIWRRYVWDRLSKGISTGRRRNCAMQEWRMGEGERTRCIIKLWELEIKWRELRPSFLNPSPFSINSDSNNYNDFKQLTRISLWLKFCVTFSLVSRPAVFFFVQPLNDPVISIIARLLIATVLYLGLAHFQNGKLCVIFRFSLLVFNNNGKLIVMIINRRFLNYQS